MLVSVNEGRSEFLAAQWADISMACPTMNLASVRTMLCGGVGRISHMQREVVNEDEIVTCKGLRRAVIVEDLQDMLASAWCWCGLACSDKR